jgi:hypothetical protein
MLLAASLRTYYLKCNLLDFDELLEAVAAELARLNLFLFEVEIPNPPQLFLFCNPYDEITDLLQNKKLLIFKRIQLQCRNDFI